MKQFVHTVCTGLYIKAHKLTFTSLRCNSYRLGGQTQVNMVEVEKNINSDEGSMCKSRGGIVWASDREYLFV